MSEFNEILNADHSVEDIDEIGTEWNGEANPPAPPESDDWDETDAPDESYAADAGYTLKHLGREVNVTRDEIITLAQKGMDYDRIRARSDALMLKSAETDGYSERRDRELLEFVSVYRDVAPDSIPAEVWSEVETGRTLLTAYQGYENRRLKERLMDDMNRRRSTGSRATFGKAQERGELEHDWYRD